MRETVARPGDGDPLARAIFVVGQVDVGIVREVVEFAAGVAGYEPEVGASRALLVGHRARDEMPVTATRGQHRRVELFNHRVERVEFFIFRHTLRSASEVPSSHGLRLASRGAVALER